MELLDLQAVEQILRKLYEKNEKGWGAVNRFTDSGLLNFTIRGPETLIEVYSDSPYPFLTGDISRLPRPWRPIGMAAILDEDPAKFPTVSHPYGLRSVSKKTFEKLMMATRMMLEEKSEEEVKSFYYKDVLKPHLRSAVTTYDKVTTPMVSVGPYLYRSIELSESHRKLREKLEAKVIEMRHRERPYIS